MDLFDAIAQRCSYRDTFTEQLIPREHLVKIVQAGIQAPSGQNEQTTSFIIIDDAQLLDQIAAIIDRPVCSTARAMIACVVDPRQILPGMSFFVEDCAAAVENMLLAITALGYAAVWLDGVLRRDNNAQRLGTLLGVPKGKMLRILLPLGVPAAPARQNTRLPFDQRAWFNRFGG
jgi:nitroreductase